MPTPPQPARPRAPIPLYRLSLPGLATWIGTADELFPAVGDTIACALQAGFFGPPGSDAALDHVQATLTCELLPARPIPAGSGVRR